MFFTVFVDSAQMSHENLNDQFVHIDIA